MCQQSQKSSIKVSNEHKVYASRDSIELTLQHREPLGPGIYDWSTWRKVTIRKSIAPQKTGIVVVDVWTSHSCSSANNHYRSFIPLMNETLDAVRKLGIQVIFASSGMDLTSWEDKPQIMNVKKLAHHSLHKSNGFKPPMNGFVSGWASNCMCKVTGLAPGTNQPKYNCNRVTGNSNQHPDLGVKEQDLFIQAGIYRPGKELAIDSWGEPAQQELWNLCQERGITHLIYMGFATNMCIINREFGMIQMKRLGLETILIRDLTYAMTFDGYNPDTKKLDQNFTPDRGTELSIQFIERYIGPSIDRKQLLIAAEVAEAELAKVNSEKSDKRLYDKSMVSEYKPIGASNCYRHICFDFNWLGGDLEDYFTRADPVTYAEFCKQINLDAVILMAYSHHGYASYDSKIMEKFPGMLGDWFGETIEELHKRGIAAIAYITLARNWKYPIEHPEQAWMRVSGSKREHFLCLNSPYVDQVIAISQEVLRNYPVDALRYDTLEQPLYHHCNGCKAFYRELYGEELPQKWEEWNWRRQYEFQRASSSRAVEWIYKACKKVKPSVEIWQNGFMHNGRFDENNMEAARFQDMAYIESGDPFRQLFLKGVTRCNGIVVGKILQSPIRRLCVALGGSAYSYYPVNRETLLPETEEQEWYTENLGPFYKMVSEIQPYLGGAEAVPYIGVVFCEATRYRYNHYDRSRYMKLLRTLTESYLDRSLPVEFISNLDLPSDNLSRFKLLVLPETSGIKPAELDALKNYVNEGGQLLLAGHALRYDEGGLAMEDFALGKEMGVRYDQSLYRLADTSNTSALIRLQLPIKMELHDAKEWSDRKFPATIAANSLIRILPFEGQTVLSTEYDGQSIPVLHVNYQGKGRIAYLSVSEDVDLMQSAINAMTRSLPVTTTGGKRVILTRQNKEKRWILHLIGDGDFIVDIHHDYAAPQKVISQYPETGWQYKMEKTATGLQIRVKGDRKNRLLVLG